jgi:hypothetical protein
MTTRNLYRFLYIPFLFIWGCTLFPKEEKLLKEYSTDGKFFKAYYVGLGATTNDVIQIREVTGSGQKLIKAIEGYNHVMDMHLKDQRTLLVILSDTSHFSNKPDTLKIDLE